MDWIIHLIEGNLKHGFKKYQEMSAERQKQILWIVFEEFVTKTEENLARVENFLGVKRSNYTTKQLKKERCPRVLDNGDREKKKEFIKSKASPEAFDKIKELCEYYEAVKK